MTYRYVEDAPYYNNACAALVACSPFGRPSTLGRCRTACAIMLRRIRRYGTRQQLKDFHYHMSWVSYPLRKRPNGRWI